MRLKGDLVLFVVAVLWGSAFAAQRIAGQLGSVHFFNAARFLLAGVILLPFAFRSPWTWVQLRWTCAAGAVLFAGSALQQAGLQTTTAGNAGFLTSLYVVIVPLVMFLGWKDKPRLNSIVAILLAAIGAYLLSTGGRYRIQGGDVLELAGAALWAVHVVILGKFAARYDPISFSSGQLLLASSLSWVASALWETTPYPLDSTLLAAILYTAVVSLALGYTLQIWGQRHTPPTDAAILLSLEAVFAALAGALLLQERLNSVQLLGCTIIVIAVVVSQAAAWSRMSTTRDSRQG
jgi:drug/metabolite transporter (DMT)-like permease